MGRRSFVKINDVVVRAYVDGVKNFLTDLSPVLADMGDYMYVQTIKHFEQETDPEGIPWKPLKIQTLAMSFYEMGGRYHRGKGKFGRAKSLSKYAAHRQILTKTGRLRHSIRIAPRNQFKTEIGTPLPEYLVHELGDDRTPQRAFVGFGSQNLDHLLDMVKAKLRP